MFFHLWKNAGLTGLVSLPMLQQCKLLPQSTSTKVWSYHPQRDGIRDCTCGPFNPSSVRRPKKGQTGINSHFTELLLLSHKELSEIQALLSYRQRAIRCHWQSAVLDAIQNTDLEMKGFVSYYRFPRHLILTPTNSSSNLLINLHPDSPRLLPLGICLTPVCFWKQFCCIGLFLLSLRVFMLIWSSELVICYSATARI